MLSEAARTTFGLWVSIDDTSNVNDEAYCLKKVEG